MASRLFNTTLKTLPRVAATRLATKWIRPSIVPQMRLYSDSTASQLKQVLSSELKISKSLPLEFDATYQEYLDKQGFSLIETDGTSAVELVKTASDGNIIHVYFDVDEITDIPVEENFEEEAEVGEDSLEEEYGAMDSMLSNVKILIENKGRNDGLFMNLYLQNTDLSFLVDFVNYQKDATKFVTENVAKGEFIDKFQYQGPRFSDLDESLQVAFEEYLEERGINEELAEFVISYSEVKEEKEYRNWLGEVNNFL
ncbi:Mitochondrial acidic protein mam33 [Scheffersomyces spartinae]|uniref:Mitochondrial acidic protein mam33 n=1 Tax=Scheffersomyces spartinae TaxID=45513 RepID=A0A9P7V789_9ASCO|nr:Mitochondrial acidic protein mam33 [Scheffersomyces spartinae]KAG7192669.1 Mitochondrial acidic protein mam33 [Scheffersomyces spartinae]